MTKNNQIIKDGYESGVPISELEKMTGMHRSTIKRRAKKMGLTHYGSTQAKRDRIQNEIISMGIDPSQVDHGWIKTDEASIHFRNDLSQVNIQDTFDKWLGSIKKHAPKYPVIKRKKITDKHMMVLDPADVHVGKLAIASETGEDYNIEIAKERVKEAVEGLLEKAQAFPLEKIMFVIGNDVLHFDNHKRQTTSGTPQDTDGQLHQIFEEALYLYVDVVERLLTVADVEVVYNPSNHDYASGFMLAQTLAAWFRNTKNVTFDVSIRHRKYSRYGDNLFCTSHGDGAKHHDMPYLMSYEHPNWDNKRKQHRYIYLHHLHHKKVTKWQNAADTQGIHMQILRSPSAPDGWHYRNGYCTAPMAIEAFIHHKENGMVATLTHYFS